MTSLINYFFEANLCLLFLGSTYYLLLRNETDITFRRRFIIASALIALITPLLKFGAINDGASSLSEISTTILPELVIGERSSEFTIYDGGLLSYLKWVYIVGSGIIFQYLIFQLLQIAWFYHSNRNRIKPYNNINIIQTNGSLPTFSFFHLIFFDDSIPLNENEKDKVLKHELVHIEQYHSIDILVIEILKVILWVNPISWYFKKEIQEVHEYLADDKVVGQNDTTFYNSLLAKMALKKAHLSIGHHFNKSRTLKRIKMIQTIKTQVRSWKSSLLAGLLLVTTVMISCNDEVIQDIDTVMETASQSEIPDELLPNFERLKQIHPDAEFVYIETDGTSEEALKRLNDIDINTIALVHAFKEKGKVGVFVNKNGPLKNITNTPDDNEVFTLVDQTSTPIGGIDAYYQKLATILKYPKQAAKEGIEGKVYVQFIVDKTGALHDLQVVKGIGAGCDQAAVDAIRQAGNWTVPMQNGKPVKQRMVLPISFALGDQGSKSNEGK